MTAVQVEANMWSTSLSGGDQLAGRCPLHDLIDKAVIVSCELSLELAQPLLDSLLSQTFQGQGLHLGQETLNQMLALLKVEQLVVSQII